MHVTPGGAALPSELLPSLTRLNFFGHNIHARSGVARALVESILKQGELRALNIHFPEMDLDTARVLERSMPEALPYLHTLKVDFMRGMDMRPASIHHLARGFAKMSKVERLKIEVQISQRLCVRQSHCRFLYIVTLQNFYAHHEVEHTSGFGPSACISIFSHICVVCQGLASTALDSIHAPAASSRQDSSCT